MYNFRFLVFSVLFLYSLNAQEIRYSFPIDQEEMPIGIEKMEVGGWWPWDEEEDEAKDSSEDSLDLGNVLTLAERLKKNIIGQETAIDITSDAIIRFSAGVNDQKKPIGVFLYVGPSGVGKTELAKQLAKEVFGDERNMLTISMAEYNLPGSLTRLIGSPPGFVNSEDGGQFTNFLKRKKYAVVLLDEIEKGHDEVRKLFLQVFDEGKVTSAKGEVFDCSKIVFIMTSNIDALKIAKLHHNGFDAYDILDAIELDLMKELSPELYNRVQPVVFTPLSYDSILKIVDLCLAELNDRVFEKRGIKLVFKDSVREYIAMNGYHPELGARPIKRLIEKDLTTIVAKALLEGKYKKGDKMFLSVDGGQVCVKKS